MAQSVRIEIRSIGDVVCPSISETTLIGVPARSEIEAYE